MLCLVEVVGPACCREEPHYESPENRTADVVRTPAAVESIDIPGAWVPAELTKAQAVDPELDVVYG